MKIHRHTAVASRTTLPSPSMLQWTFLRGGNVVACQIDSTSEGGHYDVRILPRADVAPPVVERFDSCRGALCRHAEIAEQLRQAGWVLSAYSRHPRHHAAA